MSEEENFVNQLICEDCGGIDAKKYVIDDIEVQEDPNNPAHGLIQSTYSRKRNLCESCWKIDWRPQFGNLLLIEKHYIILTPKTLQATIDLIQKQNQKVSVLKPEIVGFLMGIGDREDE